MRISWQSSDHTAHHLTTLRGRPLSCASDTAIDITIVLSDPSAMPRSPPSHTDFPRHRWWSPILKLEKALAGRMDRYLRALQVHPEPHPHSSLAVGIRQH